MEWERGCNCQPEGEFLPVHGFQLSCLPSASGTFRGLRLFVTMSSIQRYPTCPTRGMKVLGEGPLSAHLFLGFSVCFHRSLPPHPHPASIYSSSPSPVLFFSKSFTNNLLSDIFCAYFSIEGNQVILLFN